MPEGWNPRHKSHIQMIMFLSAVSTPRVMPDGSFCDGKVGLFPFIELQPAVRNSARRPAGTMEIKPVAVTAAAYREMMTKPGGVFDKIKEKFASAQHEVTTIQHDGAPAHTGEGNELALMVAGLQDDWNITFVTQPAQSPDLNKND